MIHLEVGEPGGGPPAAVLEAARACDRPHAAWATPRRSAVRRCAAQSPRITGTRYDLAVDPEQVVDHGRRVGRLRAEPSSPRSTQATAWSCRSPPSRHTRTFCRRSASRWCGSGSGRRPTSRRASDCCSTIAPPVHGLVIASPANPTGTMLPPAGLAGARATIAARDGIRVISDEIYHGITYGEPAASMLAVRPRCGGDQRLLQVLLHDRLAPRLAGGAARPGAPDRAPGAEPVHLGAGAGPGGGAERAFACRPRARARIDGLPAQPRSPARAPARRRSRSAGPGRRRLLPLRRRRPPDRRFSYLVRGAARGNRGRAHAGRRFRQRARPPLRPPRVRRRRAARGPGADRIAGWLRTGS